MSHRLSNYLRTYRRRAGISQRDLAALLGSASGTKVSRYENRSRMPALKTVWAYEIVFNQPSQELFAGEYESIRHAVRERAQRLLTKLRRDESPASTRTDTKVALLRSIIGEGSPAVPEAH